MKHNIGVVVVSCDSYSDAWKPFETCFKKFWSDCEYNCYLVNNEKKTGIDGFSIINTGPEISWSRKVREALGKIEEDYILFLLEDYFLTQHIENKMILEDAEFLQSHNAGYLSYFPVKGMESSEKKGIAVITEDNIYGKVLQPSLWKKDYLMQCLYDDDFSAWEFENRQKISNSKRVLGIDYCTSYFPIKWVNGILQGKWFGPSINYLKKIDIDIDTSTREILPWFATKKYQIKSKLFGKLSVDKIKKYREIAEKMGVTFVTKS